MMLKTPNRVLYGRQLHFNNYNNSLEDGVFDAHNHIVGNRIESLLEYMGF